MKKLSTIIFIFFVLNVFPQTISCPPDARYYISSLDELTLHSVFPYSETGITITLNQFINEGGSATAACGIKEILYSDVKDPIWNCPKKITRTFVLTDSCDNVVSCSQVILIDDMEPPTIFKIPDNLSLEGCSVDELTIHTGLPCSDSMIEIDLADTSLVNISADDNWGIEDFMYIDIQSGFCPIIIERVFYVVDSCGNVSSCVQIIKMDDITPPIMDCPPDTTIYPGQTTPKPFTSYAEFIAAGGSAWDNCGLVETSFRMITETRDGEHPQIITRTYEIKDSCDLPATCEQIITVYDTSMIMMICPPTIILDCGIDEIPDEYSNYDEFLNAGGYAVSSPFPIDPSTFYLVSEEPNNEHCPEIITRIYSVANTNGEYVSCEQLIYIYDVTPPFMFLRTKRINCIFELPVIYKTQSDLFGPGQGNATDECALDWGSFRFVSESSDGNNCPETIYRVYEIADMCGNTYRATEPITINDTIPPEIICPPEMTVNCITDISFSDFNLSDFLAFGGMISDNCSIDVSSFNVHYENNIYNGDNIKELRYEIADSCGNIGICSQRITVNDNIDPKINCPPDIHISATNDIPERYYTINEFVQAGGSLSDNCGIDSTSFTLISEFMDTVPDPDILKRTYYIADFNMNDDICLQRLILDYTTGSEFSYKEGFICNIYPNPNEGIFILNITGTKNKSVLIDIFGNAGKHIYSKELLMETNTIDYKINLSDKAKGVYHIKVSEGVNVVTKSIVIH